MNYIENKLANSITKDGIIDTLTSLVKIKSPFFHEEKITKFVAKWFMKAGLDVMLQEVREDKITKFHGQNVIVRLKGIKKGKKLLLNAHMDTVIEGKGWTHKPYEAEIEDDKLYGLGALDMKSGLAATMVALEAMKENKIDLTGDVLFTAVVGEEGPFQLGTDTLIREGTIKDCDFAIVPEPITTFAKKRFPCIGLGARGGFMYNIFVQGKSSHGAEPERGISALNDAAQIILALDKKKVGFHKKLGMGSVCVVGLEVKSLGLSLPDLCRIDVFRHTVLGETRHKDKEELEEIIKNLKLSSKISVNFRRNPYPDTGFYEPYVTSETEQVVKSLKKAIRKICKNKPSIGYMKSVGDFNYIATRAKIPTAIFGAEGDNYHAPDEYVKISSVVDTAKILALTILDLLG